MLFISKRPSPESDRRSTFHSGGPGSGPQQILQKTIRIRSDFQDAPPAWQRLPGEFHPCRRRVLAHARANWAAQAAGPSGSAKSCQQILLKPPFFHKLCLGCAALRVWDHLFHSSGVDKLPVYITAVHKEEQDQNKFCAAPLGKSRHEKNKLRRLSPRTPGRRACAWPPPCRPPLWPSR